MTKTVFITGVNGGIGSTFGKIFREAGWSVVGTDIRNDYNADCSFFFNVDVSQARGIIEVQEALLSNQVRLNCVINNAALQIEKSLVETTEDEWRKVFNTNVGSIFLTSKYLFPLFEDCSIINISSVHSRATSKRIASYVASKGAVSALTRAMAMEFADHGIRVNAILPGAIDTEMLHRGLSRNGDHDGALETIIACTPLKRIGYPEDVAQLALFLADDSKSGNITGQEFVCDGGVLAKLATE